MADEYNADRPDMTWSVRLNQVDRLDREEGDEGEEFFTVEFELSGLGVTGTLSAMIVDPASEESIVSEAVDQLLVGLEQFAASLRARTKPGSAEPSEA